MNRVTFDELITKMISKSLVYRPHLVDGPDARVPAGVEVEHGARLATDARARLPVGLGGYLVNIFRLCFVLIKWYVLFLLYG